jgi:uncharacterized protein with HEPN domain
VSRHSTDRLIDIAVACERIAEYTARSEISDDIVFDAIRMRLVEIGEAVKDLDDETRSLAPELPWAEIARMRDMLAHRYFDTTHAIVSATARDDVPRLAEAVRRMLGREP